MGFYLTYEELKREHTIAYKRAKISILSYLWGIET